MAVNESLYAEKIHVDLESYHYLLGRGYSTLKRGRLFFRVVGKS